MGLYDQVRVLGEWCCCSEGHDLRGELLQTKDLGCTMADWELADALTGEPGGHGEPEPLPFSGTIEIYTFCPSCPAFLQRGTWNVLQAWVEFEVELDGGRVVRVWRVGETSAEWIEAMRREGALGPMTVDEAVKECGARRAAERGRG